MIITYLMTNDVENLGLIGPFIYVRGEISLKIHCLFYSFFLILDRKGYLYPLDTRAFLRYVTYKYSVIMWIIFSLSWWYILRHKSFNFDKVHLNQFYFLVLVHFGFIFMKALAKRKSYKFTSKLLPKKYVFLPLIFTSLLILS